MLGETEKGDRIGGVIFALALLLLFEFLVHLEQDTEAEVVADDFKPCQLLDECVDELETRRRVQRTNFESEEGFKLSRAFLGKAA